MTKYSVYIYYTIEVEANDESQAQDMALMNLADSTGAIEITEIEEQ